MNPLLLRLTKELLSTLCFTSILTLSSFASSLPEAARRGDAKVIHELIIQGADLDNPDEDGNTALHWAALNRDSRLVKNLLERGAAVDPLNKVTATPLIYAVNDLESVRALLEKGADPNHTTKFKSTPLLSAANCAQSGEVIKLLLEYKANPLAKPNAQILDAAASNGDLLSVKLLLEAGVPAKDVNRSSWRGDLEIVKALHSAGADIHAPYEFAGHALNASLYGHNPDVAKYLINQGADLTVRSPRGQHETPPLLWAAYNETGDASIAQLMLDKGADVNIASALGETALDWARDRRNTALEEVLLKAGAQESGRTAKHKDIPNNRLPNGIQKLNPIIRDSATRAIDLLQRTSDGYLNSGVVQKQQCVSCHQQTLPAITFGSAMERGFELDELSIARQVQDQVEYWSKNNKIPRAYEMKSPQPDASIVIGHGLLGLAALDHPIDPLVESATRYLAAMQRSDGSWIVNDYRPPMEDGPILGTAFAIRSLSLYPISGISHELAQQKNKARQYLHAAVPDNFNQEAFRLLGLSWAGETTENLKQYAKAIIHKQSANGGWPQLEGLPSDAWATGIALVALNESGAVSIEDKAFQKGIRFLLRTQFDDGSWYVRSRAWPFQPHFESGFPHGKDQWISTGATAWATMALLLTQAKIETVPKPNWLAVKVPELYSKDKVSRKTATVSSFDPQTVDYLRDIKPIFERSCYGCHSSEAKKLKGDFSLEERSSFLSGGQSHDPVVALGDAEDSDLIWMITDQIEDLEMPPLSKRDKYEVLSPSEIDVLKVWINQGLPWEN